MISSYSVKKKDDFNGRARRLSLWRSCISDINEAGTPGKRRVSTSLAPLGITFIYEGEDVNCASVVLN